MQCKPVGAFDKDDNLTGLHVRLSGQSLVVRPAIVGQQKGRDPTRCRIREHYDVGNVQGARIRNST